LENQNESNENNCANNLSFFGNNPIANISNVSGVE
jgi:hypothetical protein